MTDRPAALARFAVERDGDGFLLLFEDQVGAVVRLHADEEQLDVLADLIDDALGTSERG